MPMTCRLPKVAKIRKIETIKVESWDEKYSETVVIPHLKGCTIQHVNNLHVQAVTVKYPGATPHQGRTKSYTDAESSKASARHCAEWVWQQHRKADLSVECPWDFGDAC